MRISFSHPERQFVAEPVEGVTEKVRAACELAGVDRYTFLDFCKRENVSLRTQTSNELEKDLNQLTCC